VKVAAFGIFATQPIVTGWLIISFRYNVYNIASLAIHITALQADIQVKNIRGDYTTRLSAFNSQYLPTISLSKQNIILSAQESQPG
jgi:hypothetical protein